MSDTEAGGSTFFAVGTSLEPFLIIRNDLAELKSALTSAGLLNAAGQPASPVNVYDVRGAKVPARLFADPCTDIPMPLKPPSEQDHRAFYARVASVLAAQAAMAADIASGAAQPNAELRRCACCWCYLGFSC
jgi:hypothetical protein